MTTDIESVQVALRIRPLVLSEIERGCQEAVERVPGAPQVTVNRLDAFTYSYVFDARDSQELVYQKSVSALLDKLFGGFNATILAYGQTGSGKTHTMGTAFDGELNEHAGVIPRATHDIFRRIDELQNQYEFVVTCSFMELYQEQLFDLLSTKPREEAIVDMREDRNGIIIPGLTEERVFSARETTNCLMRGAAGRAVASTAMNKQSSRSHAIFTVTLQATKKDETRSVTTSKFHLVDLAGSERSKKTLATGDRFKEGIKINQGLLALGNVISALGSGQGTGFVRYRDSKLTRLLQDSLGGNSVTLMIACISPADYNVPESLSTLRYADRACKIKNKPVVNQDPHAAEINHLKSIIQKLRMELLTVGGGLNVSRRVSEMGVNNTSTHPPESAAAPETQGEVQGVLYQQLQEKYHSVQRQLQRTLHDVAENEMRAHIAEMAHDKLKTKTEQLKTIVQDLRRDFTEESCAAKMSENLARVQQIHELVVGLDEELERTETEISVHKRSCSLAGEAATDSGGDDDDEEEKHEIHALLQEQTDAHNRKQMGIKEQLRRMNRELNLKEELHQRVAENLSKFNTLDDNVGLKFKECEAKIHELEAEKAELLGKLRHVKSEANSAKIAEERRKRLQALEQEINEMKRKNIQQAKLLKVREKATEKIKNLSSEIQTMKESKVKLIRAMRQESENFRQWKLIREKELMQLRNKDRKLQNEMARKEALHTKQRNVLKRKCEEAMAINKRLKDALERQKVAQTQRQKMQSTRDANANVATPSKIEQIVSFAEREVEVIVSLIDAEHTLEQLMEDRALVKKQIGELRQPVAPAAGTTAADELAQLEEELEMRNAQIADLQQKVCATDVESRVRALGEGIQSVAEGRAVLRHLLKAIGEMRREMSTFEDQRALREAAEERCNVAAKRVRLLEIEHEEAMAERENAYEEKIAVLLRELYNVPQLPEGTEMTPEQAELMRIQTEQLDKMDALRDELEHYKKMVTQLQTAVEKLNERRARIRQEAAMEYVVGNVVDLMSSSEEDAFKDDTNGDPDWKKTPRFFKRSSTRRTTTTNVTAPVSASATAPTSAPAGAALHRSHSNSNSDTSATNTDETFVTAATSNNNYNQSKRKLHTCSCRGTCQTKRCGCMSNNLRCSSRCRCGNSCQNHGKGGGGGGGNNPNGSGSESGGGSLMNDDSVGSNNKLMSTTFLATLDENQQLITTTTTGATFTPPQAPAPMTTANATHIENAMATKIARLSTLPFNTPTAKKKFFE